ncbi:MAG: FkbM family methyltransferase, partial [Novosphingobium sp.]
RSYTVKTVAFNELLERHQAPALMDYLSIDTEGSELEILSSLDFSRFRFRVITCEHNFTPNREKIHELLVRHGYERRLETVSQFDDWYVLKD